LDSSFESLKKEINILRECDSPYILRYYGSYLKDNKVWIIIEYCDAGSVLDLMKITKKTLNEEQIASITQMVLKGLKFLHSNKKIHRDIKAGNILLNHDGFAKLADFGVSAQLCDSFSKKNSRIGTPYWMSPEVIQKSEYDFSTDIWSLGVTCIELAEGEPPYSNIKPLQAMMMIVKNPPQGLSNHDSWSEEFNDFINKCLNKYPEKRPNVDELLNHPFIRYKSRGPILISELVEKSLEEISNFRKINFEDGDANSSSSNIITIPENNVATVLINEDIPKLNVDDNTYINTLEEHESIINAVIKNVTNSDNLLQNTNNNNKFKCNNNEFIDIDIRGLSYEDDDKDLEDTVKENKPFHLPDLDENKNYNNKNNYCESVKMIEILNDKELSNNSLNDIKNKINKLYVERDNEINNIKIKYRKRMEKLKLALNFLNKFPFLKNLKEFEKYEDLKNCLYCSKENNIKESGNLFTNSTFNETSVESSNKDINTIKVDSFKSNNLIKFEKYK
jgi:serine/threonine protein kinase